MRESIWAPGGSPPSSFLRLRVPNNARTGSLGPRSADSRSFASRACRALGPHPFDPLSLRVRADPQRGPAGGVSCRRAAVSAPRAHHTRAGVVVLIGGPPLPSWLSVLSPQQYAAPAVVTPQASNCSTLTAAKVSPPDTATGVRLMVKVPLPSWPLPLKPQQYAAPGVVTPQVW